MHTLDWLNKHGRILRGGIQPIECILFASLSFSLSLQCDLAFTLLSSKMSRYLLYGILWRGFTLSTTDLWGIQKRMLPDWVCAVCYKSVHHLEHQQQNYILSIGFSQRYKCVDRHGPCWYFVLKKSSRAPRQPWAVYSSGSWERWQEYYWPIDQGPVSQREKIDRNCKSIKSAFKVQCDVTM